MKNLHLPFWIAGSAALCLLAIAKPAWSQVTADGSTTTDVDLTMTSCLSTFCISNNGISSPPNEFHSFSQFSVGAGEIAEFIPAMGIENIIVRVIGSSVSDIQGTIFVDTLLSNPVNLFFINPNGIIFGPNASLIGINSFIATTASAIKFADGTEFSATDTTPPVLTSSIPSSLEFRGVASPIVVDGSYLAIDNPGQTLALVGGDLTLTNTLSGVEGGRVELGSVAGSGSVGLTEVTKGWSLDYSGIQTPNAAGKLFGNIQLSQSLVDASDKYSMIGGGEIQVRSDRLILDNSQIVSTNYGTNAGGSMTVTASSVEIKGTFLDLSIPMPAGLSVQTQGSGAAGNIAINTGQLIVKDGGEVSTPTFADGRGGDITINATQLIQLSDASRLISSTQGAGNSGNITIKTGQLIIQNQAQIDASTFATGNAGNVVVSATDSIQITGASPSDNSLVRISGILSQSDENATGLPGNLTIATGKLIQRDGGAISTQSRSSGRGNITINAPQIQLFNGSVISADSFGSATGGTITITTDFIFGQGNSDIVSGATNNRGGQIVVNAIGIFGLYKQDNLTPGNDIVTDSALGVQFNGPITLNTPDIDPLRGLIEQPKIPAPGKVASGCDASGAIASNPNYFIQPGKGGLSPTPTDPISSLAIWDDVRSINISNGDRSPAVAPQATSSRRSPKEIRVAQGWTLKEGSRDTVVLVVNPPNVAANTNIQAAVACHNFRS